MYLAMSIDQGLHGTEHRDAESKQRLQHALGWNQELYVLEKRDGKVEQRAVLPVVFVPMTGGAEED